MSQQTDLEEHLAELHRGKVPYERQESGHKTIIRVPIYRLAHAFDENGKAMGQRTYD